MNDYVLSFSNYCWSNSVDTAPAVGGIYCVYSCNRVGAQLLVDRLLYIGQTDSFARRFKEHMDAQRFGEVLSRGQLVFFSWAELDGRSLDACEAALVYHFQPPYNDHLKASFENHGVTTVSVSGKWAFKIAGTFTQVPTRK